MFQLLNSRPYGVYMYPEKDCVCAPGNIQRYLNKISGPLLDRIDIHMKIVPESYDELSERRPAEGREEIREGVVAARDKQSERFNEKEQIYSNAPMSSKLIRKHGEIDPAGKILLKKSHGKVRFISPRLAPYLESFTNHCRSGRKRKHSIASFSRSDSI